MKTFEEQNQELIKFDRTFDSSNRQQCVHRAMLLLLNRKAQMEEEDYVWPYRSLAALAHACTSMVRDRNEKETGETMMAAAMRFVEDRELDLDMYREVTDNLNANIDRE